jgi:hypothetical protein
LTLNQLADELFEIRRYVRSHPEHVKERLRDTVLFGRIYAVRRRDAELQRLGENIYMALDSILHDPEILRGYLYGAAQEIRALATREEAAE